MPRRRWAIPDWVVFVALCAIAAGAFYVAAWVEANG